MPSDYGNFGNADLPDYKMKRTMGVTMEGSFVEGSFRINFIVSNKQYGEISVHWPPKLWAFRLNKTFPSKASPDPV